jgi:hypothetical protein
MGLHYVAGLLLFWVVDVAVHGVLSGLLLHGGLWALERPWYVTVALLLAFIVFGVIMGLWMLGEFVHMSITKIFTLVIKGLDFIDSQTPDGTVGVIGFVFLFLGFLFQMLGSYTGRAQ